MNIAIDPTTLRRKKDQRRSLILNVRATGEDAELFAMLEQRFPHLSHSQLVRDSIRVATFLLLMKQQGKSVPVTLGKDTQEVLDYLGVFDGSLE